MADVLERGAVAFLYRPRVETFAVRGLDDIQRFYVLLAPEEGGRVRRVRVGRKRLPDAGRHERFWAYVDRVAGDVAGALEDLGASEYWTRTRGLRHQPGGRVAGEGAYAIVRHGAHVHLEYELSGRRPLQVAPHRERHVDRAAPSAPAPRGDVEAELRIAPRGRYVVAVFTRSAAVAGAAEERRFVPLAPAHLDVPGTELVLVAAPAAQRADAPGPGAGASDPP